MMTISNTKPVSEVERPAAHNAKQNFPAENNQQETAHTFPEAKVEPTDTEPLKEVLAQSDISLNFKRDDKTGRVVIEMIDNVTGDPVMQIPNEVSLRLSEMFSKVQGQLFEARF